MNLSQPLGCGRLVEKPDGVVSGEDNLFDGHLESRHDYFSFAGSIPTNLTHFGITSTANHLPVADTYPLPNSPGREALRCGSGSKPLRHHNRHGPAPRQVPAIAQTTARDKSRQQASEQEPSAILPAGQRVGMGCRGCRAGANTARPFPVPPLRTRRSPGRRQRPSGSPPLLGPGTVFPSSRRPSPRPPPNRHTTGPPIPAERRSRSRPTPRTTSASLRPRPIRLGRRLRRRRTAGRPARRPASGRRQRQPQHGGSRR